MINYQELIKNAPSLAYLNHLSEEQASFLNQILSYYPDPVILFLVLELKNQNALDILKSLSQINIDLLLSLIGVFQINNRYEMKIQSCKKRCSIWIMHLFAKINAYLQSNLHKKSV